MSRYYISERGRFIILNYTHKTSNLATHMLVISDHDFWKPERSRVTAKWSPRFCAIWHSGSPLSLLSYWVTVSSEVFCCFQRETEFRTDVMKLYKWEGETMGVKSDRYSWVPKLLRAKETHFFQLLIYYLLILGKPLWNVNNWAMNSTYNKCDLWYTFIKLHT